MLVIFGAVCLFNWLFYVFLKIKIQCWKNHILSLVDFQKKFIYY